MVTKLPVEVQMAYWNAAKTGNIDHLKKLVVQHRQLCPQTFSFAADYEQLAMMEFLVREWRSEIGEREFLQSLILALRQKKRSVASFLLKCGVPIDRGIDMAGNTPLIIAAEQGLSDIVQELIQLGAKLNCQNVSLVEKMKGGDSGQTALMVAVEKCRLDVVKVLLAAGASVNEVGQGGKTSLDYAKAEKYKVIRSELIGFGAKTGKEMAALPLENTVAKQQAEKKGNLAPIQNQGQVRSLLENYCGAKSRKLAEVGNVWFCHYKPAGKKSSGSVVHKTLERIRMELVKQVAPATFWVIRTYIPSLGVGLCVLEARDKFDVVKKLKFSGRKHGVSNQNVIKFLKMLNQMAEFELLQCSGEVLSGRFEKGVKKSLQISKELIGFCPFVAEEFGGDLKRLAAHLEAGGEFTIGWN